jgi:hypothetical protein
MRPAPFFAAIALALFGATACATPPGPERAQLADARADNVDALKSALADALGVAQVEFGAVDLSTATAIPVLPPAPSRLESKSLARPILFDLEIEHGDCRAVRRDSGEIFALTGVRCRAA